MSGADNVIPPELQNQNNWAWTWLILFSFFVPPFFWLFGFVFWIPLTWLLFLYNWAVSIYSFGIMLFERPQSLQFSEYLTYPVRRQIVQQIIIVINSLVLYIPGVSIILSPLLGIWYVFDYLDYPGAESVTMTLGIPFNGAYDERKLSTYHDPNYNHDHNNNYDYNYDYNYNDYNNWNY